MRRGSATARKSSLLVWLAGIVGVDLLLSAGLWIASPLWVRHWNTTCSPHTALVVFFGGENSHTQSRVDTAREALQRCVELRAFLVGGARPQRGFFGSDEMKDQLTKRGIAEERLTTERLSFDSIGNIDAMFALARERRPRELVFVSDPLHIARLDLIAGYHVMSERYRFSGLPAWPRDDAFAFWWRPHYEAVAWIVRMLPEELYTRITRRLRA